MVTFIWNGELLTDVSSKIGYMLQKDTLLEWKTILDNVLFGLEITHQKTKHNIKVKNI